MIKKYWCAETGIFLGLWLGLMVFGRSQLFRDPGTLWHVVVGQRILSSGRFPTTDALSFTHAGRAWIARQWLAECTMALIHQVSRLDGLLLAAATLLAGLYTWAAHRLITAGTHWLLALLLVALALGASAFHFHPRPHLATLVLLGWVFALLCDFEAGRIPLARLTWVIPLFLVWVNAHDGVLGGIATMGLTVAGWGLAWGLGWAGPIAGKRQLVWLAILVVLCGLTIVVNPYGLEAPRAWLALVGSPVLPRLIDEHGPLLARSTGPMILPMAVVYAVILLGVRPLRLRVTWLIPLVWLGLAFTRIRHGPLFAITALVVLPDLFPRTCWAAWLVRAGSDLYRPPPPDPAPRPARFDLRPAVIPLGVVLTAVVLQLAGVHVPVIGCGWATLDRRYWPVDLLPELRAYEREHPDGTPVFNEMLFGGFLIYHTPGLRVFIDDRCEIYGDDGLLAYAEAIEHDPAQVDRWAREFGFDLALTATGSSFDRYLRQARGWGLVRQTEAASLYRRAFYPQAAQRSHPWRR
ncbi:MAG: hypothetical protein ACLQIB_08525 [Isosphaeraceae bacterium]